MVGTLNPVATGTVAAKTNKKIPPHPESKLINILSIMVMRKAGIVENTYFPMKNF